MHLQQKKEPKSINSVDSMQIFNDVSRFGIHEWR